MLYSVSGVLGAKGENFTVLETGDFGFKIFTHRRTLEKLPPAGGSAKLFLYLYIREDEMELYGFLTPQERVFFEMLNSVAGVGPKSALAIMEIAELKNLAAAIKEGRADLLTRASGIGRKTAERIILELRNKVEVERSEAVVKKMERDRDLLEMLVGLGYPRDDAKRALEKVPEKSQHLEERLKEALKILSRK